MSKTANKIPFFKPADTDATIGVFFDGFSKIIVAVSILTGTLALSGDVVFGKVMPGVFVGVLLCSGLLWLYYRQLAKEQNNPDLVAIPGGLQAGRIFIWLFSIMVPVYSTTGDGMLALKVGIFANFVSGLIFILGAFVVPHLVKIIPAGALFGSLAGGAIAFLALSPIAGMFNIPMVGWVSMFALLIIYLARLEVKIPAAFIAIALGSAVAWAIGAMDGGAVAASFKDFGVYIPTFEFGIFSSEVMQATIPYVAIIIIFTIGEVITGIQAVEQARECGDEFEVTKPLVLTGIASSVSALFGNPFALGLYWGYPAWKKAKAGTGYHLGVIVLYAVVGLTGLASVVNALIPPAAVLPILLFIGLASAAQAFEVCDKKYYPAVILALLPTVIEYIWGQITGGINAGINAVTAITGETYNIVAGSELMRGQFMDVGFEAFAYGSAFIGIILGTIFVFVIDNKWKNAAIASFVGMVLALTGIIHSPTLGNPNMTFVIIYGVTGITFMAFEALKVNKKKEIIKESKAA